MFAAFDLDQDDKVVLQETVDGNHRDRSVVFAAKSWRNVDEAIPGAVAQLISAVHELCPEFRPQIETAYEEAGFSTLVPVSQNNVEIRSDRRQHIVVMLDSSDFSDEQFTDLYSRLDEALQAGNVGEVTGSGHGLGGRNLDVSLTRKWRGRRILRKELAKLPAGVSVRASVEGSGKTIKL